MTEPLDAAKMTPENLAKFVSAAYKRRVTVADVERIAKLGNLIDADGRVNLLDFTTYLIEHRAKKTSR